MRSYESFMGLKKSTISFRKGKESVLELTQIYEDSCKDFRKITRYISKGVGNKGSHKIFSIYPESWNCGKSDPTMKIDVTITDDSGMFDIKVKQPNKKEYKTYHNLDGAIIHTPFTVSDSKLATTIRSRIEALQTIDKQIEDAESDYESFSKKLYSGGAPYNVSNKRKLENLKGNIRDLKRRRTALLELD